jgi:electron transport complex protein RnfG
MKKLKSSLPNMLSVLTVIAVVAGAVLAYVNSVTAPQIEKINADNLAAGIKAVMGSDDIQVSDPQDVDGFIVYDVTAGDNDLGQAIVTTDKNGFGGPLKVLVGFDNEGTILGYTVLEHAETPGLGAKAGDWFQKDGKGCIIGKNPGKCNFTVSKDGGEIDAITASTITSRAFLRSVKNAYDNIVAKSDGVSAATEQVNNEND